MGKWEKNREPPILSGLLSNVILSHLQAKGKKFEFHPAKMELGGWTKMSRFWKNSQKNK
jgi:hypothetical protein